jgi:hypothetical protein
MIISCSGHVAGVAADASPVPARLRAANETVTGTTDSADNPFNLHAIRGSVNPSRVNGLTERSRRPAMSPRQMHAAVLHGIGQTPRYEAFPAPVAGDGEAVVTVTAAALKPSWGHASTDRRVVLVP